MADESLPSEKQLMETALAVFAKEGYDGTSMRGLARQLGVSHNFLSSRYGSKDNFWKQVVSSTCTVLSEDLLQQQKEIEASDLPVEEKLRAVFRMHLNGLPMLTQLQQLMISEGPDKKRKKSERLDYLFECNPLDLEFLEGLLDQGRREGVFSDLPVPVAVVLLLLMQNGPNALSLKPLAPYLYSEQVPSDDALIDSVLDIIMAGIVQPADAVK